MGRSSISFLLMDFILLFSVIGFIIIVFDLKGFAFVIELMLLLVFIFFLAFGMFSVYFSKNFGWLIIGAVLVLMLLDAFFIFLLTGAFGTAHITTVFFSVLGLVVVLFNLKGLPQEFYSSGEKHEEINEYYPAGEKTEVKEAKLEKQELKQEIKEEIKEELKKEEEEPKAIEKSFTPGKFVASKKANKFHSPKCDWAKRINKANQIWFNSKGEAEKSGFEADKCV